jgi:hypothetical protein
VDDRRRGLLRELGRLVGQLAPGEVSLDSVPQHVLGDPRDPGNRGRNLLPVRKRDQGRMRARHCRAEDAGPADFKEMPSRRRGRGLAVDDQHLKLRERLGA